MLDKIFGKLVDWTEGTFLETYVYFFWRKLDDIYIFISNFPRCIKILIDYLPIIWGNYDWDHNYFIELIIFKLKRMEKRFNSKDCWIEQKEALRVVKEIKEVIDNLETYRGEPLEKEFEKLDKEYGRTEMISKPSILDEDDKFKNKDLTTIEFIRPKITDEETRKKIEKKNIDLIRKNERIKQTALKKAFALIGKNVENWWD